MMLPRISAASAAAAAIILCQCPSLGLRTRKVQQGRGQHQPPHSWCPTSRGGTTTTSHHRFIAVRAGGDGRGGDDANADKKKGMVTKQQQPPSSSSTQPDWSTYVDLLRAHNILPSMFLSVLGAWVGTHDLRHVLMNPTVLFVAVISAVVAVGSCVLNDYFDLRIDAINKPEGAVRPTTALLIGSSLLTTAFASATLVSSPLLRWIIRSAVLATTLYTPIFKPVPFIKNAVVAGVTSASLVLGGLASGANVHEVAMPALLVFLAVLHREVLMDIDDVEGDAQCGIWTVPRLLGKPGALASVASLLAIGVTAVAYQLITQSSGTAGLLPGLMVSLAGVTIAGFDVAVARKGFQHEDLSRVINYSVVPMALALVVLGMGGSSPSPA